MINEYSKIKEWYLKEYSSDSLGNQLLDGTTFYDLFYALDRKNKHISGMYKRCKK